MAAIFAFKCNSCGEMHEGSPSFSYPHPLAYELLSEEERRKAKLNSDLCMLSNENGAHRFVRVVLEIPIHGVDEPFTWGVWASLSEGNFMRYLDTCNNPDESDSYFGWFCNRLPYYPNTVNLKTNVRPRKGGMRPYLDLERNGHLLAEHLYNGITVQLAQEIAEVAQHRR
jgi:hypothetical protein